METLGDVFARERRSDDVALVDDAGREYDYHWLCTAAWKAGNFLRHAGVRRGVTVGVVGTGPLALLAFFGTGLLRGTTRFDPPRDLADAAAFRAVVAPTGELGAYDLPRGAQRVGYGSDPDAPDVHHFDAGLWSENPSFPSLEIDSETPLLTDGETVWSHGEAHEAAATVVTEYGLDPSRRVVVRTASFDYETVVAGVIAPLVAGSTIVLERGESSATTDPDAADPVIVESREGATVEAIDIDGIGR